MDEIRSFCILQMVIASHSRKKGKPSKSSSLAFFLPTQLHEAPAGLRSVGSQDARDPQGLLLSSAPMGFHTPSLTYKIIGLEQRSLRALSKIKDEGWRRENKFPTTKPKNEGKQKLKIKESTSNHCEIISMASTHHIIRDLATSGDSGQTSDLTGPHVRLDLTRCVCIIRLDFSVHLDLMFDLVCLLCLRGSFGAFPHSFHESIVLTIWCLRCYTFALLLTRPLNMPRDPIILAMLQNTLGRRKK